MAGTDHVLKCEFNPATGTCNQGSPGIAQTYRLDISAETLAWSSAGVMTKRRWYPTVILAHSPERAEVFGHIGTPVNQAQEYRDEYTVETGTWNTALLPNLVDDPQCAANVPFEISGYPRMHLLRSGYIVHVNAKQTVGGVDVALPARYLDIIEPDCPGQPRWADGVLPGSTRDEVHLNGGSVHLITWNGGNSFTEVIYEIGGSTKPVGGNPCDCFPTPPTWQSPDVYLTTVEKMVVDGFMLHAGIWDDAGVPDLNFSRVNHNTVIGLDGSLFVNGGTSFENGACVDRKCVERYRPPEVFGPGAGTFWEVLVEQMVRRGYHSASGLLPDGRILSGGGRNLPDAQDPVPVAANCLPATPFEDWDDSIHSVEIFSPPYYFLPRPAIEVDTLVNQDPAAEPYNHNEEIIFDVTLVSATDIVHRVALLRTAAATHAFDSDQRYVELRIMQVDTPDPTGAPKRRTVTAELPQDPSWAPSGYYMLTVKDQLHRPAEAAWIRLVPEEL